MPILSQIKNPYKAKKAKQGLTNDSNNQITDLK
jgi:hypothetical protein